MTDPAAHADHLSNADRLVRLELHDGGVAVIRLNRPKVNAINPELTAELQEVVDHLHAKLLRLVDGMQLPEARVEATRRHAWLQAFLVELNAELNAE